MNHSFTGIGSAEGHHEREPLSFVEIPLAEVPEAIGARWEIRNEDGITPYLPRRKEGSEWRSAFLNAYRLEKNPEEPRETVYVLVNIGEPTAGEYISFATLRDGAVVHSGLTTFNGANRRLEGSLPPIYKDQVFAAYIDTEQNEQKKGIGKRAMHAMNDFSISRYGKPLRSDLRAYHTLNSSGVRPGWKTWESLERDGVVTRYDTPQGPRFKFPDPEGGEEEGRFTF